MSETRPGMLALQEALRSLEAQAKAARKRRGLPHSRNSAAKEAREQQGGGPDARRIGEWLRVMDPHAPRDEDEVWTLVRVWGRWAGQPMRKEQRLYWNNLVRIAQPQRAAPMKEATKAAEGRRKAPFGQDKVLDRLPENTGTHRPMTENRLVPLRLVRECDPILLGVHRPIRVDSDSALPALPLFIERDHDRQLRYNLTNLQQNQMIVLTGASSTGKTRSAWEAILACLPDWTLIRPATTDDVIQIADNIQIPARSVIWLDEAQTYFYGPAGTEAAVRLLNLLSAQKAIVILGSMWPDHWQVLATRPKPDEPDRWRLSRELLTDHATEIALPDSFIDDPHALQRLSDLAAHDRRLGIAYANARLDGKITQILSGGTLLVRRYERATDHRAKAVITAAMDARRLGHYGPLPAGFLRTAAAGYLTETQRATRQDWFNRAIIYATEEERGVAALTPIQPAAQVGPADMYILHDYLDQHSRAIHGDACIPALTWDALVAYTTDHRDLYWIARSAHDRMLYGYAERLYVSAAAAGDTLASADLAELMHVQGREDELRKLVESGVSRARGALVELLMEQERVDEVWAELVLAGGEATTVNGFLATQRLIGWLSGQGCEDELRALADLGNVRAQHSLMDLLARQEREDDLRELADTGDNHARWTLARMLRHQGRVDEAITELRRGAASGDTDARDSLFDLLVECGRLDEAVVALRELGGELPDNVLVRERLVEALAEQGHEEGLRALANAGELNAPSELARLVAEQGREDELRELAITGDIEAGRLLAESLAKQGRENELRELVGADVDYARWALIDLMVAQERENDLRQFANDDAAAANYVRRRLADLLVKQGRLDEAIAEIRQLTTGDGDCSWELADLLARCGCEDKLREMADSGKNAAANRLLDLLVKNGRWDELHSLADAGYADARWRLAYMLASQGRTDEAIAELRVLADWPEPLPPLWQGPIIMPFGRIEPISGNSAVRRQLAYLLEKQGRLDEAIAIGRELAAVGDVHFAHWKLPELLASHGLVDEAIAGLRELAIKDAASSKFRLANLLRKHRRENDLRMQVTAGNHYARQELLSLLGEQGRNNEVGIIKRFGINPDGSSAWPSPRMRELAIRRLWT